MVNRLPHNVKGFIISSTRTGRQTRDFGRGETPKENTLSNYPFRISNYSFTNLLTSVPIYGRISTANSSPSLTDTLGVLPTPTPAGVPVRMIVPAGSVVPVDRKLMSLGMLKIESLPYVSRVPNRGCLDAHTRHRSPAGLRHSSVPACGVCSGLGSTRARQE